MQNKLTLLSALLLLCLFTSNPIFSAEIYSQNSGEWENPDTWEGSQVPTENDDVFIRNEHKISLQKPAIIISIEVQGILYLSTEFETLQVLKSIVVKEKGEIITDEVKNQKIIFAGTFFNEGMIKVPFIEFDGEDQVVFESKRELIVQKIISNGKNEKAQLSLNFTSLKPYDVNEPWLELLNGKVIIQGDFSMDSPTLFIDKNAGNQAVINNKSALSIDNPAYFFNLTTASLLVEGSFSMLQGKCRIGSLLEHNLLYSKDASLIFEGGETSIAGTILSKGKASNIIFGTVNIQLNTIGILSTDKHILDLVAFQVFINGTHFHFQNPVNSKKECIFIAADKLESKNIFYTFHNPTKAYFPYFIGGDFENIEIVGDKNNIVLSKNSEIKNLNINQGILDLNGKNLNLLSDVLNTGLLKSNGGNIHFIGENTQKMSGNGSFGTKTEALDAVYFNNEKGITIDANVSAIFSKSIFLQKGNITNSKKLNFDKNALLVIGGNDGISEAGRLDETPTYSNDVLLTLSYQKQAKKAKITYEMPNNKQVERLVIANEKGVLLSNNLQINKELDLQSGVLNIDNFYLTILGKTSATNGKKSYVATNGSGTMKQIVGKDEVLFPIGLSENSYDPIKIVNRGKEDFFSVKVSNEVLFAGNKDKIIHRNWEVTESEQGGSLIDIAMSFDSSATYGSAFNKNNEIVMGTFNAKKELWAEIGTSSTGSFYQSNDHKTFSNFALSNRTGLIPANTAAEFRGKILAGDAFLTWTTLSEANNKNFTIEKSSDLKNFTDLATIDAIGFSSSPKNYSHTDVGFFRTSYYRLRQEDNAGKISYSNTIVVYKNENNNITLFPNPISSKEILNIKTIDNKPYLMEIYDNNGRKINSYEVENRDFQIDLKAYQSGVYFVRTIDEDNQILTSRLVITNF